jgi:hypothetical protein
MFVVCRNPGLRHPKRQNFGPRAVPPQYPPSTLSPLLSRYYERMNLVLARKSEGSLKGVRNPAMRTPRTRVALAHYHGPDRHIQPLGAVSK